MGNIICSLFPSEFVIVFGEILCGNEYEEHKWNVKINLDLLFTAADTFLDLDNGSFQL